MSRVGPRIPTATSLGGPTTFSGKPPILRRPDKIDDLIDGRLMARLDQIDVVSRKIFAGKVQGERRSKRRGISVEFADFRPYVHGDDLRFVDWNIYGRLDRLFLKVFLEEEDLSLVICVDTSASMRWGNPDKFVFAQRLAMALGYVGLVNHNRVSLVSWGSAANGGGLQRLSGVRGRRRTAEMGQWLLRQEPTPDPKQVDPTTAMGFDDAMRSIALSRQGRGVMIILSDFLLKQGYEKGLRYLAGGAGGYDVFAMQILSPEEIDPAANGVAGDLRLVDVEDQDVNEVTITPPLLKAYRDRLNAYCGKMREFCIRRGITHVLVDTQTDIDELLLDYLRKRGLLR
ncbi:MAG: DUF58 domain-containing protein [Phycisphaerae bacterium]|jgi:uncharacterized protein (DUF58 family)|nr:DUF58 domain-containing protein [Phycisphaerae bacterium]